jgi:hypothetical protein
MLKRWVIFLFGWTVGVSPFVIADLYGWRPTGLWNLLITLAGMAGGGAALRLAQRKGMVRTSEEIHRPLTLFQTEPRRFR